MLVDKLAPGMSVIAVLPEARLVQKDSEINSISLRILQKRDCMPHASKHRED